MSPRPKIDLERIRAVRRIVVHADCPDGMASARILQHALPDARVVFVNYGPTLRDLPVEERTLFCDIAPYAGEQADAFLDAGAIVLDHHGGEAGKVTRRFEEAHLGRFAEEGELAYDDQGPGVSGAVLAYLCVWLRLFDASLDYLRSGVERARHERDEFRGIETDHSIRAIQDRVGRFAGRAGIRDTFQTSHHGWDDACAQAEALMMLGWSTPPPRPFLTLEELEAGRICFARRKRRAEAIATRGLLRLGAVGVYNEQEKTISDVADWFRGEAEVCRQKGGVAPPLWTPRVVAGFHYVVEDGGRAARLVVSLRSVDPDVDVQAIAMANGGGGHKRAAGFSLELDEVEHQSPFIAIDYAFCKAGRRDLVRGVLGGES